MYGVFIEEYSMVVFSSKRISKFYLLFSFHLDQYILFDFPGQVELFTANNNINLILQEMEKQGFRVIYFYIN